MVVRQLGQPVDLFASVPKTGVIQPGRYMDALRERFQPIAGQGDVANQLTQFQVMKRDADRQEAEYQAAMRNRNSAASAASNYQPPGLSLGLNGGGSGSKVAGGRYTGAYVNPVPGYNPSGSWGKYPVSRKNHPALDFAVPRGTRVGSPVSGRVVVAGWDSGGFGNSVRIQGDDGRYWILGHLDAVKVRMGQRVSAGQYVGPSGSSGRSTGPHLHLESRGSLWNPSTAYNFSSLFGW
jgi:murein DD-endopeptidase MepM/ murein hydrolase activator NlpD